VGAKAEFATTKAMTATAISTTPPAASLAMKRLRAENVT